MTKSLKLLATLRDVVGAKQIDVPFEDGETVRVLLQSINERYPALGEKIILGEELTGLVHILVQGRNITWLQGLDTPVGESDVVTLLPPSAGG